MLLLEKRAELLLFHIGMAHCYGKLAFQAKKRALTVTGTCATKPRKTVFCKALRQNTEISRIYDEIESGVSATM